MLDLVFLLRALFNNLGVAGKNANNNKRLYCWIIIESLVQGKMYKDECMKTVSYFK